MQDCGIGFERVRKHTRGLALAEPNGAVASAAPGRRCEDVDHRGSALQAADGIGGLLAVYDLNDTPGAGQTGDDLQYVYAYDGNGNVVQVLDWSASSAPDAIVAKYEYDPYGNVVAQAGDYAERNPIRFSTKQWDDETGFGYWEQRYYSPRLGRWISRDPIGEEGFVLGPTAADWAPTFPEGRLEEGQPYTYVINSPVNGYDVLGLMSPCAEAKAKGLDKGDWGGVVCKKGRKHYCIWTPRGTHSGIDYCIGQHERDHEDDVDCPKCCAESVTRPEWKPGKNANEEECSAWKATLDCLNKNKPYHCNKLRGQARKTCRKEFDDVITHAKNMKARFCGAASQPTGGQ